MAVENVALLVLAAGTVGALVTSGLPGQVAAGAGQAICRLSRGDCRQRSDAVVAKPAFWNAPVARTRQYAPAPSGSAPTLPPQPPGAGPIPHRPGRPKVPRVIKYEGRVVRREGQPPTGNQAVDRAYDTLDKVQQYFWDRYGRNSYDDKGGTIEVDVRKSASTKWDEYKPAIDVDDDEITPDQMAYAFAQAMVWRKLPTGTALSEQRALRMGLAQIFASNIEQDWQVGEQKRSVWEQSFSKPDHPPRFDLADPHNVGSAAHVSEFTDDWDHAYDNSHIIGHAYFKMAGRIGRKAAEDIVYRAVTKHMQKNSGFEDFRSAVLDASVELFGEPQKNWTYRSIVTSFDEVGLDGTWSHWEAPDS
ncbi:Thermolysin metallopeptidase, alpha-helical domain [Thermomonospora echinospora]|uniref:Thermolysin metallopeptidase, alpha-helical domain n=1 Tax=Thermomonospora echinospora TaxID=1992 RepID=A0A1H6DJV0_9ACTN|nr:M4 family metallopeptidase [Thermomonospora echinospora]SEG85687.1 Thermolysin metallopeptidase, alpha-helical domain [Thermomonospora echinospora]